MIRIIALSKYLVEEVKQLLRPIKSVWKYPKVKIATGVLIGKNCIFGKSVCIHKNAILSNVSIGSYTYIGGSSEIANAKVGKYCSIAPEVKIGLGMHPVDKISTYPGFYSIRSSVAVRISIDRKVKETDIVSVGNDVWVGMGSMIMDGVSIGNGAVIAAGSIVTKDVQPYSIVGGVPAKLIRKRFEDEQIDLLEKFRWWDRGLNYCISNSELFRDNEKFFLHIKDSIGNENC